MKNAAYTCIVLLTIVATLIYGQNLLVPFLLALLLWFTMRSLKKNLNKIPLVQKHFPSWVKTFISTGFIVVLVMALFQILSNNINTLTNAIQTYNSNLDIVMTKINERFNIDLIELSKKQMGDFDFTNILGSVLSTISGMIGNSFMIILYALFILLEESNFPTKLKAMFDDHEDFQEFTNISQKIENSIGSYFRLKTFVSLITGLASYIALAWIGIDAPIFWAFLIFIFNFIPTIGSLVGTLFPAIFALIQFGEINTFLLVLIIVGIIQVLVGNLLEPRVMGSSMNISPLVTIISLSLWGAIWGVVGMIISVPVTVIMIIVFSHFKKTRPIAILLSEKGKINGSQA